MTLRKDKFDLNNLIAKYENEGRNYKAMNTVEQFKPKMEVRQSFYANRATQPEFNYDAKASRNNNIKKYDLPSKDDDIIDLKGKFYMSKQQCQTHLEDVKASIQQQQRKLNMDPKSTFSQMIQNFSKSYEQTNRQIMQLLEKAFIENKRRIEQQLNRNFSVEPSQFIKVKFQIGALKQQIQGYLIKLKDNNHYRQAISEVVLKDYTKQYQYLTNEITKAKQQYYENIAEIYPDVGKVQCIKNDLNSLYYLKKKAAKLVDNTLSFVFGGGQKKQLSPSKYNKYEPEPEQGARTRKSFFNFGN